MLASGAGATLLISTYFIASKFACASATLHMDGTVLGRAIKLVLIMYQLTFIIKIAALSHVKYSMREHVKRLRRSCLVASIVKPISHIHSSNKY